MAPESSPEPEPTRAILVVEDDVTVRTIISEALRDSGLRVIEASTADEAWAYLKVNSLVGVIFSDIHMPGSMSGEQFAAKVEIEYRHIPVILTSGGGSGKTTQSQFIRKPYRLGDVIRVINAILNESDSGNSG